MTIAHKLPARVKYHCDICGKDDFWGPEWSRFSSIALDEACPDDVPTACSEKCRDELDKKIKTREFILPKLKMDAGGFRVMKERIGY